MHKNKGKACYLKRCSRPATVRQLCQSHYQIGNRIARFNPETSWEDIYAQLNERSEKRLVRAKEVEEVQETEETQEIYAKKILDNICLVVGCEAPQKGKHLCGPHYGAYTKTQQRERVSSLGSRCSIS